MYIIKVNSSELFVAVTIHKKHMKLVKVGRPKKKKVTYTDTNWRITALFRN